MATGDLLNNVGTRTLPARVLVPPEDAAAEALAAYLARACFTIHEGDPPVGELSRARTFQLVAVGTDWPSAGVQLEYPSATIFGGDDTQHIGSGTPRPMEHLWDRVARTVPWLLGTATGTFQVDFWADSAPVRQAIAARLPELFSPGENRAGILLELPQDYLGLAGRFSLKGKGRRDVPDSIWGGEHRLRATVTWEVPDVSVRFAQEQPVCAAVEVTTTADGPRLPGAQTK